jgi:hypothetical protein
MAKSSGPRMIGAPASIFMPYSRTPSSPAGLVPATPSPRSQAADRVRSGLSPPWRREAGPGPGSARPVSAGSWTRPKSSTCRRYSRLVPERPVPDHQPDPEPDHEQRVDAVEAGHGGAAHKADDSE